MARFVFLTLKGGFEVKKLFVGSLPTSTTEESLQALFSQFGKVHSLKLVKDLFSGSCKGFGFLEMEGHEARAAIAGLDGKSFEGNSLKVKFEDEQKTKGSKGRRH
jgi:RNA recognition motif-containing protein